MVICQISQVLHHASQLSGWIKQAWCGACRHYQITPCDDASLSQRKPLVLDARPFPRKLFQASIHRMAGIIATGNVALQISITALVLAFTSRAFGLRLACLNLVICCAYVQTHYVKSIQTSVARGFLANSPFVLVLLYIDKVLLSRWTYTAQGPTSSTGGLQPVKDVQARQPTVKAPQEDGTANDVWLRLRFGFGLSLQSRFAITKWPVKNIPIFARADPSFVPRKTDYLRVAIPKCILYFLLLDLAGLLNGSNNNNNHLVFSTDRVPLFARLGNVSIEELSTRSASVLAFWILQYIVIELVYGAVAMVAVTFGRSTVEAWPPMFGSLQDSYSLRQFWGCFYHQLVRRGCGSIAHAITYHALGLSRGRFLGRYLFIFLTFAVSGAFHTFSDISQGVPLQESGAMSFFCIQAVGIMVEDGVQAIFLTSTPKLWGQKRAYLLRRLIGYLWVLTWLIWTTPAWTYPLMRQDQGGRLLPVSVLASVARIH